MMIDMMPETVLGGMADKEDIKLHGKPNMTQKS